MSQTAPKVLHYLATAYASELALGRIFQSQLALRPPRPYANVLEHQLAETLRHVERIRTRQIQLGYGSAPDGLVSRVTQAIRGRRQALGGSGPDRPVADVVDRTIDNASDACATAALKLATYTALERLASETGDDDTAALAATMVAATDDMLRRTLAGIPSLVADAESPGAR